MKEDEVVIYDLSLLLFKIVHLTKRGSSLSSLSTPVTSCRGRMVALLYLVERDENGPLADWNQGR